MWLRSKSVYTLEDFEIIEHALQEYYAILRVGSEEEQNVEFLLSKIRKEMEEKQELSI